LTKAIIIGGGPSITENIEEMKRLGDFDGVILCTDNSVERMIQAGFRNFYAVTLEDTADLNKYYIPKDVKEHGSEILGGFVSERVHRDTKSAMKEAGIDPQPVPECKGYITSNVGLYCWLIAIHHFKCNEIYLVGMDHCYGPNDKIKVDKHSDDDDERELYTLAFQELVNPFTNETCILHPANTLWHEEFIWYQEKFPDIKTINCTGRGALYEECFHWNPISKMKSWSDY